MAKHDKDPADTEHGQDSDEQAGQSSDDLEAIAGTAEPPAGAERSHPRLPGYADSGNASSFVDQLKEPKRTQEPRFRERPPRRSPGWWRLGRRDESIYLAVVHCRGVVVGDHNKQINAFVYRIDQPTVNLAEVLAGPAVQDALAALGRADPGEFQSARERAERALTAGPWLPITLSLVDLNQTSSQGLEDLGPALSVLDGAIIVEDCRGVQMGDGNTQHNEFHYVCRNARVDAVRLLSSNRALAKALIDQAVGEGSAGAIDDVLTETLKHSAEVRKLSQPNSVHWHGYRAGRIVDRDGVVVGSHNTVKSTVSVHPIVDQTRDGIKRTLALLQLDIKTIQEREARQQEHDRRRAEERAEERERAEARERAKEFARQRAAERRQEELELERILERSRKLRQQGEEHQRTDRGQPDRPDRGSRGGGFNRI